MNWIRKITTNKLKKSRLEGDIGILVERIERRAIENKKQNESWYTSAKKHIEDATKFLQVKEIDQAWKNFHAACRMEYYGMSEKELSNEVIILREESVKLNPWRKAAVAQLIGTKESPKDVKDSETISKVAQIIHEHYSNNYYKNDLSEKSFSILAWVLSFLILGLLIFIFLMKCCWLLDCCGDGRMSVAVALNGALGATISALFKLRDTSSATRIPEMIANTNFTLIRVIMGAGMALPIYFLLKTDLASDILNLDLSSKNVYLFFFFGFVGGFTERLLLNAVSKVAGNE
jgi:hypothetical protein